MKVTIEGNPKEIAAYEQGLKDGKKNAIGAETPSGEDEQFQRAINRVCGKLVRGEK